MCAPMCVIVMVGCGPESPTLGASRDGFAVASPGVVVYREARRRRADIRLALANLDDLEADELGLIKGFAFTLGSSLRFAKLSTLALGKRSFRGPSCPLESV